MFLNTVAGFIQQVTTVISGLIIPRLILSNFGSATNGLVSSITQFLAFISLCELGVGAVVQSALYKPLAEKDVIQVSKIMSSANRFFRKVAVVLLGYVVVLMIIFPYISNSSFDHVFTASLIAIIAVQSFTQYYFSIAYKLLLNASQLCYVHMLFSTLTVILTTVASVVVMKLGYGIHTVKLVCAAIFILQPILINIYVDRRCKIDKKIKFEGETIKQKWNGLAQHFSTVILEHTDTLVLTVLSTLENVSIYAVYHMVINGIRQLIISSMSGIKSYLGTAYAEDTTEIINRKFSKIEWVMHSCVTLLFTVMGVLIIPFVKIYTSDVTDANYIVPIFSAIMVAAQGIYCIRLPYNFMVQAAGHYKETQTSAIVEAVINLIVSVALVIKFGLVGVAIGTFISMTYRTVYFVWYLSKNILKRSMKYFIYQTVVDVLIVAITILTTSWIKLTAVSYFAWILLALVVFVIAVVILLLLNLIFYRKNVVWLANNFKMKLIKKR